MPPPKLVAVFPLVGLLDALLRWAGSRTGTAVETGLRMASPSELTLIVLGIALAAGAISIQQAGFWTIVTALGLTLTPVLAVLGRRLSRRVRGATRSAGACVREGAGGGGGRAGGGGTGTAGRAGRKGRGL